MEHVDSTRTPLELLDGLTISERQERIMDTQADEGLSLSKAQRASYIKHTILTLRQLIGITDPIEARRKIFDMVQDSVAHLSEMGVKFSFVGFERENLEILQDTHISFGNHTRSGIEAFYVHAMMPFNTRVVVKEELLKIPFGIGDGFATTDPIVMKQGTVVGVTREVMKTIKKGEERVHIFPEGTRSKDGSLLDFQGVSGLVQISQRNRGKRVGVVTTDSFSILPFSVEDILQVHKYKKLRSGYKGQVRFYLDFVDIEHKDPGEAEQEVREVMVSRLDESLRQREKELGILQIST